MDEKQRSKTGNIILLMIYLALVFGLGYMFILNEQLSTKLDRQSSVLREFNVSENSIKNDTERLRNDLNRISKSFKYIVDGKELSGDKLIAYIEKIEKERDSIKNVYDYAKGSYGFKIKVDIVKSGNTTTTTTSTVSGTRADSAKVTYYFFKDRIFKKKGYWYADGTSKKDLEKIEKVINEELMPQAREILKKHGDTSKKNN
ncbi:reticulon family protein [Pedobacter ureilyticus]|uniref:Uncharacterized protein n=1 Tax=Pedobacter ureilyticus TaxID=1393051 RepID=A0ABW9J348_9SPHI|nr:reticulon family protein [Pedobacter helvus]